MKTFKTERYKYSPLPGVLAPGPLGKLHAALRDNTSTVCIRELPLSTRRNCELYDHLRDLLLNAAPQLLFDSQQPRSDLIVYHESYELQRLTSKGVVKRYAYFVLDDFSKAKTLGALAPDRMYDLPWTLKVLHRTAQILDQLHGNKCFHGRLCPKSILVFQESAAKEETVTVRLKDFEVPLTELENEILPISWVAPEHLSNQSSSASARSDQFQLALVSYYALTGENAIADIRAYRRTRQLFGKDWQRRLAQGVSEELSRRNFIASLVAQSEAYWTAWDQEIDKLQRGLEGNFQKQKTDLESVISKDSFPETLSRRIGELESLISFFKQLKWGCEEV